MDRLLLRIETYCVRIDCFLFKLSLLYAAYILSEFVDVPDVTPHLYMSIHNNYM